MSLSSVKTFFQALQLDVSILETDITGHPVGGVCPFGLAQPLPIYLDVSLKAFGEVLPAADSVNSAVRISVALLEQVTQGVWVDVCQAVEAISSH